MVYWIVTLLALLSKIGKSENVTSSLERAKASKVLNPISFLDALIVEWRPSTTVPVWFRTVLAATVCEAILGSVLISAGCSSSGLLDAPYQKHESTCPHNVRSIRSRGERSVPHSTYPTTRRLGTP